MVYACVINSPSTFTCYLDLLNFISESGLSYFRVLTICLLLVYFVSAAGCHCFDPPVCKKPCVVLEWNSGPPCEANCSGMPYVTNAHDRLLTNPFDPLSEHSVTGQLE